MMANDQLSYEQRQQIRRAYARVSEKGWGWALGALAALALFGATIILVLKGGPDPGPRLGLLAVYFPGYRVTWLGAFVGGAYAFVLGYIGGRVTATIYNRIVDRRS